MLVSSQRDAEEIRLRESFCGSLVVVQSSLFGNDACAECLVAREYKTAYG